MKVVKLQRMVLENFKCHRYQVLEFGGENVTIYGDNAAGKSSVYDGLCWLLYGRDGAGNSEKQMEVKPLGADGQVRDHQAVTAVEAAFTVGEVPLTLRRTLRESWVIRRGKMELDFDGNVSSYFVDGVAVKRSGFEEAIGRLSGEEVFPLLTNVHYFASTIKWQQRRALLFEMAGAMGDRQLLRREEQFAPLEEALGEDSISQCQAKLQARKRCLQGARDDTPARLSECDHLLEGLGESDFAGAQGEKNVLLREIGACRSGLCPERAGKKAKLAEAREEYRREKAAFDASLARLTRLISIQQEERSRKKRELDALTREERRILASVFQEECCPSCGQILPPEKRAVLKAQFQADRERSLERIRQRIGWGQSLLEDSEKTLMSLEAEKNALREPEESARLLRELEAAAAGPEEQEKKLARLEERVRELDAILSRKAAYEMTLQRKKNLLEDLCRTEEALGETEKMLNLLEQFQHYKAEFLEDAVSLPFRLARFRLFREQVSGGLEERCDVTVEGVPYGSLNHAMKINAGLDMVNALSRHFGISLPIFIDNAESVTRLEPCRAQVIRLVVSPGDYELRME